jgi:hypothetical protein
MRKRTSSEVRTTRKRQGKKKKEKRLMVTVDGTETVGTAQQQW